MVEKIRVSLWDIFSFFLTGLLLALVITFFLTAHDVLSANALLDGLSKFPPAITIIIAPLTFTLFGMLIEPFANYFDKYVLKRTHRWTSKPKEKHTREEDILINEIRTNYMGSLNGKIENPYAICKEYVETKQLSTTFMVYLSRYGFYRNCAFISVASGICAQFLPITWWGRILILIFSLIAAGVFKRRAEDFYSYMAPTVYRAFLIDKVSWVPRDGG
jgi:hypothetical protein